MNRMNVLSNQISPLEGEISISYTNVSPFFCLYKLFNGTFDTKLNLLLILLYQYWFHRKTKILRQQIFGSFKYYEFFDGFQVIIEDTEAMLKSSESLFPFHLMGFFALV